MLMHTGPMLGVGLIRLINYWYGILVVWNLMIMLTAPYPGV